MGFGKQPPTENSLRLLFIITFGVTGSIGRPHIYRPHIISISNEMYSLGPTSYVKCMDLCVLPNYRLVAAGRWHSFSLRLRPRSLCPCVPVPCIRYHGQRGLRQCWRLGTQPKKQKRKKAAECRQPLLCCSLPRMCGSFLLFWVLFF